MHRILVVEDDPQVRALLQETLHVEGYDTVLAANGEEGLLQYEKAEPDGVITDILMPDKEGLSFITELRKVAPDILIIAISGGAQKISPECNLELARMFGADHTFQKPLDIDALLALLKKTLEH